MANPSTHIVIMQELEKEKPELFTNIDKKYFYSGCIFPDINYFVPKKARKNLSMYWHRTKTSTIEFAKKLLKLAKTKQEKSFALGFLSHAIVDKNVHNYLDKNKIFEVKHFIVENFLDYDYFYKKRKIKIPYLKYPKKLLYKTFEQENEERLLKCLNINFIQKILFITSIKIQKHMVKIRYHGQKKRKYNVLNAILIFIFKNPKYEFKIDIKECLHPDLKIKEKHLKNLIIALENAKKEFAKEIKKFIA